MGVIFDGTNTKYGSLPNFSYFHRTKNSTFALWFKPAGGSLQQFIGGEDQNAGGSTRYTGFAYRGNSSGQVSLVRASTETHHDLGTPTLNAWNVAIFSRPNSGTAVSTPSALNSTDSSPSTLINQDFELLRLILGARRIAGGSTYTDFFNGKVGAWASWDRVLDASEINSLQGGAHPNTIATNLVDWMVITGTGSATTLPTNTGVTMTFVGSPTLDTDSPFIAYSITDVNTNEVVLVGSSGNEFAYTGFSGNPTAITIGGKSATGVIASLGTGTFIFPDYVDGQTYPLVGGTQTFTATYLAEEASISVTLSPKSGHSIATINSAVTNDPTYIGYHYTLANNDTIDFVSAEITVGDDGGVTTATPGTYQAWHRATSTGVMTLLNLTVNDAGVVSIGITARGLTSSGLTASGLTASGL